MADLQIRLAQLVTLLGRQNQALKSDIELIKEFDFKQAVYSPERSFIDRETQRVKNVAGGFRPVPPPAEIGFCALTLANG